MNSTTKIKFTRPEAGRYIAEYAGDRFEIFQSEYPCIGGKYWGVVRHYEDGDRVVLVDRRTEIPGFLYLADAKDYVREIIEAA